MGPLKREILELLDKDLEFRYAIAGYLGLSEVLKRLNALVEEQVKLREEQVKIWREIASLREEQAKLSEEQVKLREEQVKIWREIASLREEQAKLSEEQVKLREDFNRMLDELKRLNVRLSRVERTLEKLTVDVEDEARSVLKHKLKEMGISVELTSLTLPGLELNIYGASNDVCLIGEATVRAGADLADELLRRLERLKRDYPEKLRRKVVLAIYTSLPMAELVEKAKEKGIWLLKATEEFHKPEKLFIEL
ncbi:MAG: hypothetical protein QXK12_03980 [Candidatus Nezhaarchaeales archaeon]